MPNNIVCPLCSSGEQEKIASRVRFEKEADVYRCCGCGLTYLDQNSFDFPEDFYRSEYHQTYLTHVEPDALNPKLYYEKMLKSTAPWAERIRAMLSGKERVLDVGCSTGHVITALKDKTATIHGHDLNEREVAFCREELGLDVSSTPLEERFEPGSLDLVILLYVLEHIADPVAFLVHLKRFLKPGGKMVILVPNVRDPLVSLYDIPEFRSFYYCIEHLFYYDADTLGRVFREAGLEGTIRTLQEYPLANHLNWNFLRKPSDTLAARNGLPSIELMENAPSEQWVDLWSRFNDLYRDFLAENGYGDRLWCVVGSKVEEQG